MRDDISPKIEVLNVYVPSSFQDDDNIKKTVSLFWDFMARRRS